MPAALLSTALGFALGNFIQPALQPVSDLLSQGAYSLLPYRPLDSTTAVEAYRRGIIDKKLFHQYMKRQGLGDTASDRMFEASKTIMQANELITAKWRKIITDKEFYELSSKAGYDKATIDNIEKASQFYPSPQDFIRFMVRESFDENVVRKYGYDRDYPKQIDVLVKKAGLSPEWMKHFWRSHWQLPSISQGYEMMHRGEINTKELEDLLRIGDIPDYWRKRLINISYRPYTRVDVRRMHKEGVLSNEQVLRSYLDLGYDEEKATKMTEFTINYNLEKPKQIAETKIQDSFMSGKIKVEEAQEMLKILGYDDNGSSFIVELWKNDLEDNDISIQIDILKRNYLFGDIDEADLTGQLGKLNLPRKSVDIIRNQLEADKSGMRRMPSKTDFTRWFNSKITDEKGYRQYLKELGYGERYIENYVKETQIGGSAEFRLPTKKEILNWLKKDIIDVNHWLGLMFALGYSDENIIRYATDYNVELPSPEPLKVGEPKSVS